MRENRPLDPAPEPLVPAQDLVNTWFGRLAGDAEEGLATPVDLARWCRAHGVDVADDGVTDADLDLALVVREGVRAALAPHNDSVQPQDAQALARLRDVAGELTLAVSLAAAQPALVPVGSGVRAMLARVLAGPVVAGDQTWRRLKVCRDCRCRTAFYDYSRNGSGVWCSMAACGAANKQKAFVERRRDRTIAARAARGA
ncbi:CGNR zinc finger domain-containing protein [Pseudonocardia humida]|uniref:CGNR zinc finger domain-containing protein n=1 Tax=Pseudonocardia humida TaxID=2800819 RepID=A0ABT0ZWL3_9PSEU|nr:CGNR zinc finger domain-containing protein [Pseudonocardia humida]MCO1655049.1 CGNR zinc finger domain-containing protein [Pseudonocardia humida]